MIEKTPIDELITKSSEQHKTKIIACIQPDYSETKKKYILTVEGIENIYKKPVKTSKLILIYEELLYIYNQCIFKKNAEMILIDIETKTKITSNDLYKLLNLKYNEEKSIQDIETLKRQRARHNIPPTKKVKKFNPNHLRPINKTW